jgi:hypothetical protein
MALKQLSVFPALQACNQKYLAMSSVPQIVSDLLQELPALNKEIIVKSLKECLF